MTTVPLLTMPPRISTVSIRLAAATLLVIGLGLPIRSGAAPANDNFGNRIPLAGTNVTTVGSNVGATRETDEPAHAGSPSRMSVWWSWTAHADGYLRVSTAGSRTSFGEMDTVLGIYTGASISTLSDVAENDDGSGLTSVVVFKVAAGKSYQIAVDGYAYPDGTTETGSIMLSLLYVEAFLAPGWQLPDINGQLVSSTNMHGKVVLLNFWATWCGPCIVEIPDLIALYDQYANDGFVVVGISVDDASGASPPTDLVGQFALEYGMNYPVVMSRPWSNIEAEYGGISAIPTTFIIGRDGAFVTSIVGTSNKAEFERLIRPALYGDIQLSASLHPDGIELRWPVTVATFRIESNSSPTPTGWARVTTTIQTNDGMHNVVLPKSTGSQHFYRLRME